MAQALLGLSRSLPRLSRRDISIPFFSLNWQTDSSNSQTSDASDTPPQQHDRERRRIFAYGSWLAAGNLGWMILNTNTRWRWERDSLRRDEEHRAEDNAAHTIRNARLIESQERIMSVLDRQSQIMQQQAIAMEHGSSTMPGVLQSLTIVAGAAIYCYTRLSSNGRS